MEAKKVLSQLKQSFRKKGASAKVIFFVAMEGWSQKGGQGDYVRELSQALANHGHQVFVINPYYVRPHADLSPDKGQWLFDTEVPVGGGALRFGVFHNKIGKVHYLRFRESGGLLYPEVYPSVKINHSIYSDTMHAYIETIVLSRIGMHMVTQLRIRPDIFHFNDWQSALGPVYMEQVYRQHPAFAPYLADTGTVFVVHNLAYQGMFPGTWLMPENDPLTRELLDRWIIPLGATHYHRDAVEVDLFSLTRLPCHLQITTEGGLEYWSHLMPGRHNLLKGGLEFAGMLIAVSKGNRDEIQSDSLGFGLGGVIARRAAAGVVDYVYNGVDTSVHRPDHLSELLEVVDKEKGMGFVQYGASSQDLLKRRAQNKVALRVKVNRLISAEQGKPAPEEGIYFGQIDNSSPGDLLVASVTRIVRQKGLDILLVAMDEDREFDIHQGERLIDVLLRLRGSQGERLQFLVLGSPGDASGEALTAELRKIDRQYAGQFAAILRFDRRLANQIRCATDLFFMPSQYEPAGVANIQAAVAGALCVVTRTGGLIDFVESGGTHPAFTATTFDYDYPHTLKVTARELVRAFRTAISLYGDKRKWERCVRTAMQFEGDWSTRVGKYIDIYARCKELKKNKHTSPVITDQKMGVFIP